MPWGDQRGRDFSFPHTLGCNDIPLMRPAPWLNTFTEGCYSIIRTTVLIEYVNSHVSCVTIVQKHLPDVFPSELDQWVARYLVKHHRSVWWGTWRLYVGNVTFTRFKFPSLVVGVSSDFACFQLGVECFQSIPFIKKVGFYKFFEVKRLHCLVSPSNCEVDVKNQPLKKRKA